MPYSYHESTKLSREDKIAVKSLAATGELPKDHYWNALRTKHDANPTKFERANVVLGALLNRDQLQRQGVLGASAPLFPTGGFFKYADGKHALAMTRFDHWHPFLGRLFELKLPASLLPAAEGLTGGSGTGVVPPGNPSDLLPPVVRVRVVGTKAAVSTPAIPCPSPLRPS